MTDPPFPSLACRDGRLQFEDLTHAHLTKTPPGTCELPYRALTWPLTWCEGSARPLRAHVFPALLLMTDMPHWDLGPLLYDMGHWREGRVLGRPPATCGAHEELTLGTSIGLPVLAPAPPSPASPAPCAQTPPCPHGPSPLGFCYLLPYVMHLIPCMYVRMMFEATQGL